MVLPSPVGESVAANLTVNTPCLLPRKRGVCVYRKLVVKPCKLLLGST